MLSGPGHERPLSRHVRFAAAQRLLIQRGGAEVPVNVAGANQGASPCARSTCAVISARLLGAHPGGKRPA